MPRAAKSAKKKLQLELEYVGEVDGAGFRRRGCQIQGNYFFGGRDDRIRLWELQLDLGSRSAKDSLLPVKADLVAKNQEVQ